MNIWIRPRPIQNTHTIVEYQAKLKENWHNGRRYGRVLDYLPDLRKRKSESRQRRNIEKSSDEMFSELVCDDTCEIAEGFQKDILKMDILWLIYSTKYQKNNPQPLGISSQIQTFHSPPFTDRFNFSSIFFSLCACTHFY